MGRGSKGANREPDSLLINPQVRLDLETLAELPPTGGVTDSLAVGAVRGLRFGDLCRGATKERAAGQKDAELGIHDSAVASGGARRWGHQAQGKRCGESEKQATPNHISSFLSSDH